MPSRTASGGDLEASQPQEGVGHCYVGDRATWREGVAHFGRVTRRWSSTRS